MKLRGAVAKWMREGRFDAAIALVTKVIESEGGAIMDAFVWRARVYADAGRHPEALADLDVADRLPGNSQIEAYDQRIRSLRALGRDELAEAFAAARPRPAMPGPEAQQAFTQWLGDAIAGRPSRTIHYEVGHAFGPGGSAGRDALVLHQDDRFELENERGDETLRWVGKLHAGTHAALDVLIGTSVFPAMSPRPPVAGSAMRRLRHTGRSTLVPFHELDDLPGYRALFEALDAIVADAKAGRTSGRVAGAQASTPGRVVG